VSNVGDLGRRVAERRRQLGLSWEQVAARAGMHPSFVQLIEECPSRQLTRAALVRLSVALETTVDALSGAGMLAPPGRSRPLQHTTLTPLDTESCKELIAPGGIGRVVMATERGPVAIPVNFKMLDGDVVFRTTPSAGVVSAMARGAVSFEVDHFDDALSEGWSVLLTGEGHAVTDPAELEAVVSVGVTPWAPDGRDRYVRIAPSQLTGRRIRCR
jgi:nitroimidazol reductase NimA-like FMN-containing flavoprotein (pyridoxamine 5'-phosphate oxidase superfamily)